MQMLPLLLLCLQAAAIIIPVHAGQQRCMALYSLSQQDSVKVSVKFPQDPSIQKFYDYVTQIRDLQGHLIARSLPLNYLARIEVLVPKDTIYEACIKISHNSSKSANHSQKYYGQILVDYEANTHFITDELSAPAIANGLKECEVLALQKQAKQVIEAAQEYIKLQTLEKELETRQFSQRREIQDSLFEWWMLQLLLIVSLGLYQWSRMKRKLQGEMP